MVALLKITIRLFDENPQYYRFFKMKSQQKKKKNPARRSDEEGKKCSLTYSKGRFAELAHTILQMAAHMLSITRPFCSAFIISSSSFRMSG